MHRPRTSEPTSKLARNLVLTVSTWIHNHRDLRMAAPGLDMHADKTPNEQSPQGRRDATGREKLQLSCNACRKRK